MNMKTGVLERILRRVVWAIVCVTWIVIGTFFYVPMISRAIGLYTALVVVSMIRPRPFTSGERELSRLARFWPDGLARIKGILVAEHQPLVPTSGISPQDVVLLGVWTIMSALFWLAIGALVIR